jgi:hypothetical protein
LVSFLRVLSLILVDVSQHVCFGLNLIFSDKQSDLFEPILSPDTTHHDAHGSEPPLLAQTWQSKVIIEKFAPRGLQTFCQVWPHENSVTIVLTREPVDISHPHLFYPVIVLLSPLTQYCVCELFGMWVVTKQYGDSDRTLFVSLFDLVV